MRKKGLTKVVSTAIISAMLVGAMTGCQKTETNTETTADTTEEVVADTSAEETTNEEEVIENKDVVYTSEDGWEVRYNPDVITLNEGDGITTFVYTAESAGTNMITATYTTDSNAEDAIKEIGKNWGDAANYSENIFPGTEDVKGYWVVANPSEEGSGAYMTSIARDYKDGALIFELDGHMSGDEESDMVVSDTLAAIIDSLQFTE